MKRSNRLLILLGLLLAIAGGVGAVVFVAGSGGGAASATPTPTPEPTVPVVYATQDIPAGTTVTSGMVETRPMRLSEHEALGVQTYAAVSQVVNSIAGANIPKDSYIIAGQLLSPGSVVDGQSLSRAVAKGMVAVSMEIDQVNGVGTLIVPGDHVDLILTVWVDQMTFNVTDRAGNQISYSGPGLTSKLVFQNCIILATLLPPLEGSSNATAVAAVGSGPTPGASTAVVKFTNRHMIVILEVYPEQAEVIRWAQRAEKTDPQNYITLGLALRSAEDNGDPLSENTGLKTSGVTFWELVHKYNVLPPDPTGTLPLQIQSLIRW